MAERGGRIFLLDPATGARTLFLTLATSTEGQRGLRAIAVSPNYVADGRFFVVFTDTVGRLVIAGCLRSLSPGCFDTVVVAIRDQVNNLGTFLGYAPDGRLYAVTGDGSPNSSAQSDETIFGKLLRIDNNPDPFAGATIQYFIATTLAKGFQNPNGGGFYNGMLLVGDRGTSVRDEVDLVALSAGGNYSWPAKEGTTVLSAPPAGGIDPVLEYPFVAGGGVVGGPVYRGSVASLQGHYVFADQRGAIYSVPASRLAVGRTLGLSEVELRTADFAPDTGTLGTPVAFGEGARGELYIVSASGEIFRVGGN